jgi:hypothetical protein
MLNAVCPFNRRIQQLKPRSFSVVLGKWKTSHYGSPIEMGRGLIWIVFNVAAHVVTGREISEIEMH